MPQDQQEESQTYHYYHHIINDYNKTIIIILAVSTPYTDKTTFITGAIGEKNNYMAPCLEMLDIILKNLGKPCCTGSIPADIV